MARRRYHLDTQLLTLFFFIAMPLAAFGAFIVISMARSDLRHSVGRSLEQRALQTKLLLEHQVGDQIVHLRLLALEPGVVEAARAHRTRTVAELHALERAWVTGEHPELVAPVLASPLALRLRVVERMVPTLSLVQVIGMDGTVIASSSRASRVSYAQVVWFDSMARLESTGAWVGEVVGARPRQQHYLELGYPIVDPRDESWLGAVRAMVSTQDLYGILAPVRVGETGHAVILRASDGVIIVGDPSGQDTAQTFPGFSSIRAAMQARQGYWVVPERRALTSEDRSLPRRAPRLVGFSVVDQVPGVNWIVAVEQDLSEAVAPVDGVTRYLWLHFVGAFASVLLLALYLSLRQETPIIEEALHLHEDHVPPSFKPPSNGDQPPNGEGLA